MKGFIRLFLLLIIGTKTIEAQNAKITGNITEKGSKETIIGVNIVLEGTNYGAVTNLDGNYELTNIPPGKYTMVTTFIGYLAIREEVTLIPGQTLVKNFVLEPQTTMLSDVAVAADRITNTETAVLLEMKQASQIVSGISSQVIQRTQDRDASQVVRRIPGITLMGSYVQVRGMEPRYNNTLLHNVFTPSIEDDIKSFAFELIPSSQIDRILVYKSPSPDLPGDFAGGSVKVYTQSIPSENITSVTYNSVYRVGTSMQPFRIQESNAKGFFGFNTGKYDLPNNFPTNLRRLNDVESIDRAGKSVPNNWVPLEMTAMPDQRLSINLARRFDRGTTRIGSITAFNFSSSRTIFDVERNDFNEYDRGKSFIFSVNDRQYTQSQRLGLMHNWAFKVNPRNSYELKTMFNQLGDMRYVHRTGRNFEQLSDGQLVNNHAFEQIHRTLFSAQVLGNHESVDEKHKYDWTIGFGYAKRVRPDTRRYRSDEDAQDGTITVFLPIAPSPEVLGRVYTDMNEFSYSGVFNYQYKFNVREMPVKFMTGTFLEYKTRDFTARNFGYRVNGNSQDLVNLPIEEIFREENISFFDGLELVENTNDNDSYTAQNRLAAGYFNFDMQLNLRTHLLVGARFEYNEQALQTSQFGITIDTTARVPALLPSSTLTFDINEKTILKASYGMTLNRPEFRELSPFGFYDFNFNFTVKGNPNLQTAFIHNSDLKLEYYPKPTEVLSVAAFYKYIENPIVTVFLPGAGS